MEILNNRYQDLIDYFNDCAQACFECFNEALGTNDVAKHVKEVHFLIETAMFCQKTVAFLAMESEHLKEIVLLAAHICKVTATEINKFNDDNSKMCAKVCLETAHYAVDTFKEEQNGKNYRE